MYCSKKFGGVFFCILPCIVGVLSEIPNDITPCKVDDTVCLTKIVQWIYTTTVAGVPSLGIESTEPMHQDLIEATLSSVAFTLRNTTIEGFKSCEIKSAKISSDKSSLNVDMMCPRLFLYGDYEIGGHLVVIPIDGKGDFTLECKVYHIVIDAEIDISAGKDGNEHISLKNFKNDVELLGGMAINLTNLFNGQNELADPVLKFANENWKEVANQLQGPVLTANIKKLIKNLNKYLKTIPLERILLE